MKNWCFILLVCLAVASCSKDEGPSGDDITYPLEVKATAMEEQGPVRLYTRDGEVTDEAVIARFIAHPPKAITLSFNEAFTPSDTDFITFTTDSTASFGYSAAMYHVEKKGNNEIGFLTDFVVNSGYFGYGDFLDAYNIGKFNEPLTDLPAQSGFSFGYKGTSLTLAQGGYRTFRFPILLYYLKRTSAGPEGENGGGSLHFKKIFNEFNPDFVSYLGARDTIAVQQSYLRFEE